MITFPAEPLYVKRQHENAVVNQQECAVNLFSSGIHFITSRESCKGGKNDEKSGKKFWAIKNNSSFTVRRFILYVIKWQQETSLGETQPAVHPSQ